MYRSALEVHPKAGRRDDVVRYYREHRIIERAIERGLCVSGELLVPDAPGAPLVVSCLWPTRDDYRAWVANRPGGLDDLTAMLDLSGEGLPAAPLSRVAHTAHPMKHDHEGPTPPAVMPGSTADESREIST